MSKPMFKVGDKVVCDDRGTVEVTYGPYTNPIGGTNYVIRLSNGRETPVLSQNLTALAPAFTVGDVVALSTRRGARATVEYGPIDDNPAYLVRLVDAPDGDGNPRTFQATASCMTKVDDKPALVPVGTRVRIDRATYSEQCPGLIGTVTSNTEAWRTWADDIHVYRVRVDGCGLVYAAEVTPIDDTSTDGFGPTKFVYNGETYEYGALYRDREGDLFEFDRTMSGDGTPRGRVVYRDESPGGWMWSLAEVVCNYSPLTKQ